MGCCCAKEIDPHEVQLNYITRAGVEERQTKIRDIDINTKLDELRPEYETIETKLWGRNENFLNTLELSTSDLPFSEDLNRAGRNELPRILFVPGFGSQVSIYTKFLDYLRTRFRVTAIDQLGLGLSGKPEEFNLTDPTECVNYYLGAIEAWIRTTGYREEGEFYLCGHSLGGHIITHFAMKYPTNIAKILLFSPVGVPPAPVPNDVESVAAAQTSYLRAWMLRRFGALWVEGSSPLDMMRNYNCLHCGASIYVNRRLKI